MPRFAIEEEGGPSPDYYGMDTQLPKFSIEEDGGGRPDYYDRTSQAPRFAIEDDGVGNQKFVEKFANAIGDALSKPDVRAAIEIIRAVNAPEIRDMITSGMMSLPPGLSLGAGGNIGIAPGFSVGLVADWFNNELLPGRSGTQRMAVGGTTTSSGGGQIGFGFDPLNPYGIVEEDEYSTTGQRG